MKQFLLILSILCFRICFGQEGQKVDSKVVSATVFKDRAMVTRKAELDLTKGNHTIIFSNLITDLQDETVRLSAAGAGITKILDVKVELRFTTTIQNKRIQTLKYKVDSLKFELLIVSDQTAVLESKKNFVETLKAESIKVVNKKILMDISSTTDWTNMLHFVDKNLNDIYDGLRKQSLIKHKINRQLEAIQKTINTFRGGKNRNYKEIIVQFETSENGLIILNPSYLVKNANWYPIYDARVFSESKTLELSYFGMIQQSTGEDWEDVELTFSTAEPLTIKSLPKLERWFLDTKPLPVRRGKSPKKGTRSDFRIDYDQNWGLPQGKGIVTGYITDNETGEPLPGANVYFESTQLGSATDRNGKFYIANVPEGHYSLKASMMGYQNVEVRMEVIEKHSANLNISLSESVLAAEAVTVTAERSIILKEVSSSLTASQAGATSKITPKPKYSNVYAKELSTVFEIPTKNSIPSDNTPHKVTIAMDDLPIEFEYTSIPKIVPKVYLKGKIVNNKDYPLLEGEINVFVDNDFVNKTYLNTIVPSDTLELALGVDERIRTEKILINKFVESKGFLKSNNKITYEYEIQVTNNRKTEESIRVYDQLPITMNEKIKIELLNPIIKEDEMDNDRKIEYHLKLKPGEKKILPFKYMIEFPKNQTVYGWE